MGATTLAYGARAQSDIRDDETGLSFSWNTDPSAGGARVLEVSIITEAHVPSQGSADTSEGQNSNSNPSVDENLPTFEEEQFLKIDETSEPQTNDLFWRIRPEAFGPDAQFALRVSGETGSLEYRLRVSNVSYGRVRTTPTRPRYITFTFRQKDVAIARNAGNETRKRFVLTAHTTIWSSENGANAINGFGLAGRPATPATRGPRPDVLFRDFLSRSAELYIDLPVARVVNTARLMFNGLIGQSDRVEKGTVDLTIDATLRWRVDTRGRALSAFAGRVDLSSVTIFWPIQRTKAQAEAREAPLFAEAEVRMPATGSDEHTLVIGSGKRGPAFHGQWNPSGQKVYFRMALPVDGDGATVSRDRLRAEAFMRATWSCVAFRGSDAAQTAAGFPRLTGSLLERVEAPRTPSNSDPARAQGTISFQARYARSETEESLVGSDCAAMSTALGKLVTAGFRSEDDSNGDPATGRSGEDDLTTRQPFPNRRGNPVTALFRWGPLQKGQARRATRNDPDNRLVDAEVALLEAGIRLPGAEYSRLTFEPSALRIFYVEEPLETPPLGSFLDLRPREGKEHARLDLARANLRASRTSSLLALRFRFSDMALSFRDDRVEFMRYNTACELRTRRNATGELVPHDTRPTMVVEFPPQHLFEEARFYQTTPPLPDVKLKARLSIIRETGKVTAENYPPEQRPHYAVSSETVVIDSDNHAHVIDALEAVRCSGGTRAAKQMRKTLQMLKQGNPAGTEFNVQGLVESDVELFTQFVIRLKSAYPTLPSNVPRDQLYYVGPYGMDVDVLQTSRGAFSDLWESQANTAVERILRAAREEADKSDAPETIEQALLREGRIESAVPMYQRFRDFYREVMLTLVLTPAAQVVKDIKLANPPRTTEAREIEVFADAATGGPQFYSNTERAMIRDRFTRVAAAFADNLFQRDPLGGPSRARLSNPSRLAFRVRCRDGLDWARADGARGFDLDQTEDATERLPREELDFSLDALTHFRGMELAVMARAEIIYDPDELGRISARRPRVADTGVDAMLERLEIPLSGKENSVRNRLSAVAGTLRPPEPLETSIEIPSRLVLSPHQNAVVLTPQNAFDGGEFDHDPDPEGTMPAAIRSRNVEALWQAEFVTEADGLGLDPGIRAVHSPDLRPGALLSRFAEAAPGGGTTIGLAEPPGGPFAPWYLSRLQSQAGMMTEADLNARFDDQSGVSVCARDDRSGLPGIVARFCDYLLARKAGFPDIDEHFRAAIDARSRHQLVLLSSAWGLPVLGRRNQGGALTTDSSQFEPSERSRLWDIMPGSAIYNPRALSVTELSMSALGGTLRHDTGFQPPQAARFWRDGEAVFDAFGLERWHQWTNIGRDIFTEVVYKGYLFPLGIRASLVQVTERIIYLDPETGIISAPLRQRMFIRVANPKKLFPALRQPFDGRHFPVRQLSLLSTVTPDIVDPYGEGDPLDQVFPSGRIELKDLPGLVFWPRTFRAQPGNIRFEMEMDGVKADLPLIFVDNTAAGNSATLAALTDYYNSVVPSPDWDANNAVSAGSNAETRPVDPIRHMRTLVFGGAERRYAEEMEAGTASYQTEHWTLAASGQSGQIEAETARTPKVRKFLLKNSNFESDTLLEGADQPPFYPLVEVARVHLTQTERLVARPLKPVRALFDARYLEHGFKPEPASERSADGLVPETARQGAAVRIERDNPNEIVLMLADQVALDMKEKGDQSGGLFRPSGHVVALSRKKGAMTQASAKQVDGLGAGTIVTVVPLFGGKELVAEAVNSNGSAATPATGSAAQSYDPGADLDAIIGDLRKVYQDCFSPDAKLLGIVRIRDLIALVQRLDRPDEGLPDLSEKTEFGAGALGAVEDAITIVRTEVVSPLAAAVGRIQDEWQEIDANLKELQGGLPVESITVSEIFPELFAALIALRNALSRAEGETDEVLFALELSGCYSSGQRLLGALQRSAANPGQRVEEAFTKRFNVILGLFRSLRTQFGTLLAQFVASALGIADLEEQEPLDRLRNEAEDAIVGILTAFVSDKDGPALATELIALPRPPEMTADNRSEFEECLALLLPARQDAAAVLATFGRWMLSPRIVERALSGSLGAPEAILTDFLGSTPSTPIFQPKDLLQDLLQETAEDARTQISAEIDRVKQSVPESLHPEVDRIKSRILTGPDALFEEVIQGTEVRLHPKGGNVATQVRNRYVLCVILNIANQTDNGECVPKIREIDPDYFRDVLQWIGRLLDPPGAPDIPQIILPELLHVFEPVIGLVRRTIDLFDAITTPDVPELLSLLGDLLRELGLPPLPAGSACGIVDPVWTATSTVMTDVADLGNAVVLCPADWSGPLCPLPDTLGLGDELEDMTEAIDNMSEQSSLCGSVLAIHATARHLETLYQADPARIIEEVRTALAAFIAELDSLKEGGDIPDLAGGAAALEEARQTEARLTASIERTQTCLDRLTDISATAYCEALLSGKALNSFSRNLKLAAELPLCTGGTLNADALQSLKAFAFLPRDYEALVARRDPLFASLRNLAATLAAKLEAIRAAPLGEAQTMELLPFALLAKDLVARFDPTTGIEESDLPSSGAALRSKLDEWIDALESTQDTAFAVLQHAVETICTVLDHAEELLTDAGVLLDRARTDISRIEGQLEAAGPWQQNAAEIVAEIRRSLNIEAVEEDLARLRSEFEKLKEVRDKLCDGKTLPPGRPLSVLEDVEIDGKNILQALSDRLSDDGTDPLTGISRMTREMSQALSVLPGALRSFFEEGPRNAARVAIARKIVVLLNNTIDAPQNPFAAANGKVSVASIYASVKEARDTAQVELQSLLGTRVDLFHVRPDSARSLLTEPIYEPPAQGVELTNDNDQLAGDVSWLTFFQENLGAELDGTSALPAESAIFLLEFLREWADGRSTPLQILDNIAGLVNEVLSGDVFKYINFDVIRSEIEDYLLSLVPSKLRMGYGFSIELGNAVGPATAGIFTPAKGTRLGIDMRIVVDLLEALEGSASVEFRSAGTLGPFDVKLVGDFFDALTLSFAGAEFVSEGGGKSDIKMAYKSHKIGPKLKFVQKFQKYLAPKDGSGVILRFNGELPGIEAGYRLHLGDFSVGNMAISNVGLEATAVLPFSDKEALFKASLSSRANPFTVTYAPYGGSGFFGIFANVEGILGFDASFEFGGSAVFAYGPLTGQGRLMSGVYIRQLKLDGLRVTEISMTFFAGGSASIWIFDFSASLSVKLGQVNGDMTGEATFSFSFSMGLADFEFSIQLYKQEEEGFSGQTAARAGGSRYASLDQTSARNGRNPNPFGARVETAGTCQSKDWSTFKSYFDDGTVEEYF